MKKKLEIGPSSFTINLKEEKNGKKAQIIQH